MTIWDSITSQTQRKHEASQVPAGIPAGEAVQQQKRKSIIEQLEQDTIARYDELKVAGVQAPNHNIAMQKQIEMVFVALRMSIISRNGGVHLDKSNISDLMRVIAEDNAKVQKTHYHGWDVKGVNLLSIALAFSGVATPFLGSGLGGIGPEWHAALRASSQPLGQLGTATSHISSLFQERYAGDRQEHDHNLKTHTQRKDSYEESSRNETAKIKEAIDQMAAAAKALHDGAGAVLG